MTLPNLSDTIVALATPPGVGAIGVIRLSGPEALSVADVIFEGKKPGEQPGHTAHFGRIVTPEGRVLDEVLLTVFKKPHSYTGDDAVEIGCHGSPYILQEVIQLCLQTGARLAQPGEFTLRAFLNGKMDLSQAEAVADLVASQSEAAHSVALRQLRGGFKHEIARLREELLHFASLVELELDFGEEDVEFANRNELAALVRKMLGVIVRLLESFRLGNAIKNGVPVVIAGKPNAGKSTLLNMLLNEDRAIVSEIAGTTRDTIEEEITLGDIRFRFIDTAGLRETMDVIESRGVERTREKIRQAALVLYLFDPSETTAEELEGILRSLRDTMLTAEARLIPVLNKADRPAFSPKQAATYRHIPDLVTISAKNNLHIDTLKDKMLDLSGQAGLRYDHTILANVRHKEALEHTRQSLEKVLNGLTTGITGDLIASDIRDALYHLGLITGEVSSDDLLTNIFSRFCIGK